MVTKKQIIPLNPEQLAAVRHVDGPLRIGSVAGAGKTSVLVERCAYLIEERRVEPWRILMISFSTNAKEEMEKRIERRLPHIDAKALVRTFHSIGLDIFRQEIDPNKEWQIDSSGKFYRRAAQDAFTRMQIEPDVPAVVRYAQYVKNELYGTDEALRRLGQVDPRLFEAAELIVQRTSSDLDPEDLVNIFFVAESMRTAGIDLGQGAKTRFVTYDDMLYASAMLLRQDTVRLRWADRWKYVQADEQQDVNAVQVAIADALVSLHQNYCVVGDPAQCVAEGTLVTVPGGSKRVEDLRAGDEVVAFRNGRNVSQRVSKAWATGTQPCVSVTTKSGKHLTMSLNHRLWATSPGENKTATPHDRGVVRLLAHTSEGSQVSTECEPSVSRFMSSFATAEAFASKLATERGVHVVGTLSSDIKSDRRLRLHLCTGAALRTGMHVPVISGSSFELDEIVSVERASASCFDITVDDAGNFYGNDILSHNCIFSFRGARPDYLLKFEENYPNARTILVNRNYRSGHQIITLANKVLGAMAPETKLDMEIVCERGTDAYVALHEHDSPAEEGKRVAANCIEHQKAGVTWRDQAVLVRMNYQTRDVEVALARARVPYRLVSGQSFFALREVKILLGYLRVVAGRASQDDFEWAIQYPSRYLGKAFIEAVVAKHNGGGDFLPAVEAASKGNARTERQANEWLQLIRYLRGMHNESPWQVSTTWRGLANIDEWLRKKGAEDEDVDNEAVQNLEEIISFASDFATLTEFLDLIGQIEVFRSKTAHSSDAVTVTTVHKAKGLERRIVYLVQLGDHLFPTKRGDLAEERRLFYVAVTRAMDELWMSFTAYNSDGNSAGKPSRFLRELELSPTTKYEPGRKIGTPVQGSLLLK